MNRLVSPTLIATFVLFSPGCGGSDTQGRGDSFICTSCVESDTGTREDAGDSNSDADQRRTGPNLPACAPQPRVVETSRSPALPEHVTDGPCASKRSETDVDGDGGVDESTTWGRRGDTVFRHTKRMRGGYEKVEWALDEAGNVRRIEQESRASSQQPLRTSLWTFDDEGRLTLRRQVYDADSQSDEPQRERVLEQTFRDGHIVSRTRKVVHRGEQEPETKRWTFEYRDDRLSRGEYTTESGDRWRIDWTYERGRPVRAVQSFNGEAAYTQEWSYRSKGSVESRKLTFDLPTRPNSDVAMHLPALDDMTPAAPPTGERSHQRNPWDSAAVEQRENCRRLPYSAGHGYPDREKVYRLAWHDGTVPRYADHAYGHPGFGIFRDAGWYGHDGIFTASPVLERQTAVRMNHAEIEIHYDADGRMVGETAKLDGGDTNTAPVKFVRDRRFADGDLVEDRLVKSRGDRSRTRTLRFRHQEGRLRQRSLAVGGVEAARQTWKIDGERDVELALLFHPSVDRGPARTDMSLDDPLELEKSDLETRTTYRREFDERGRRTRYWIEPHGRTLDEIRTRYGQHGPVERVEIWERADDRREDRTIYRYDAEGRVIEERRDSDGDGTFERIQKNEYDENGRLVERTFRGGGGDLKRRTRIRFTCN